MTYTATFTKLGAAHKAGLIHRGAKRPTEEKVRRHIFVTDEVARILDGATTAALFPDGNAESRLTAFRLGQNVRVSRERRRWKKHEAPEMEQLVGVDEVWAFCFREPKPGWRMLGRFLERGVFIGLFLKHKDDLLRERYPIVTQHVISQWNNLFNIDPIRSDDISDYLGGLWEDIDEQR